MPWIVWGFFKIVTPFIDPVTRDKLKFNEDMKQYVPAEQLWSEDWGGQMGFEYDHDTYWPALNELCKQRRETKTARWTAAGQIIGESEDYLCGGTDISVTGFKYERESQAGLEETLEAVTLEEKVPVVEAETQAEAQAAVTV